MAYAKAFMVKALKEGIDDQRQLRQQAVRQALPRFRRPPSISPATARPPPSSAARSRERSTNMCARRWRRMPATRTKACGSRSTSSARRRRSTSAYDILADPALLKVVQTALGMPAEAGGAGHRQAGGTDREQARRRGPQGSARSFEAFLTRFTSLYELEREPVGDVRLRLMLIGGRRKPGSAPTFCSACRT